MTSRRVLASVAGGTASAFVSRHNDAGGWWVPGLLLQLLPDPSDTYAVDLVSGRATPPMDGTELEGLGTAWAGYLTSLVQRHRLDPGVVTSANLVVHFDRSLLVPSYVPGELDTPFDCIVTLRDHRGREYERRVASHCSAPRDLAHVESSRAIRAFVTPPGTFRVSERVS